MTFAYLHATIHILGMYICIKFGAQKMQSRVTSNIHSPVCVQNLMCLTPTVTNWLLARGFQLSMKILSVCPLVLASCSPRRHSHNTRQWASSRPTEANSLPSAEENTNSSCNFQHITNICVSFYYVGMYVLAGHILKFQNEDN